LQGAGLGLQVWVLAAGLGLQVWVLAAGLGLQVWVLAAGLTFFHMCLVVWRFGVRCLHLLLGRTGSRSHLFSHVLGCVAFWCEVFALTG
jgi:hypothetical protein